MSVVAHYKRVGFFFFDEWFVLYILYLIVFVIHGLGLSFKVQSKWLDIIYSGNKYTHTF